MGTANFMYNHRLDVVDDAITSFDIQEFFDDLKYRADEPFRNRDTQKRCRQQKIGRICVVSTTGSFEPGTYSRSYYDRNFGGTQLAKIRTETCFFGEKICLEMAVIVRHGYYEGLNIDQEIELLTSFGYYGMEDYGNESVDTAIDYIIEEYDDYKIATSNKTMRYRTGIQKRLKALEDVLWQRYEELVEPFCEQYRVFARFSNGETWYEKLEA